MNHKNGSIPSFTSRIRRVDIQRVFVPFRHVVEWSAGKRPGTTRLIIEVHTDDGVTGVGETICLLEFIEPVLRNTIVPLAIGEDPFNIERITKKVEGAGYYHHKRAMVAAVAGLEMALWDLVGKYAGQPLARLWGGVFRERVPAVAYLQSSDPEHLAAEARAFIEQGFGTIKLKIGMGVQSDIELVRAVREAVGPAIKIRADVNGAWTIGTAKSQLRKLEPFDLEYVEQPLPLEDLPGHEYLRNNTCIPIALDESAYTLQDVMAIVRHNAADVILLDPHEAGGLLATRKAAAVAESAGIPVTIHSGGELGVSQSANLHLAMSIPNLLPAIDSMYHNQSADLITEPFVYDHGDLRAPEGPGLGVHLDRARMAELATTVIANPYLDPEKPSWFPTKPQY
jgi:glucarate dehydratase